MSTYRKPTELDCLDCGSQMMDTCDGFLECDECGKTIEVRVNDMNTYTLTPTKEYRIDMDAVIAESDVNLKINALYEMLQLSQFGFRGETPPISVRLFLKEVTL